MTLGDAIAKIKEIEEHLEVHSEWADPDFYNSDRVSVSREEFRNLLKEVTEKAGSWEYDFEDSIVRYDLGDVTAYVCCTTRERTVELSDEGDLKVTTKYAPYSIAFGSESAEFLVEVEE